MIKDIIGKFKIYGPFTFIKYAIYELYLRIWMWGVKNSYSQKGEDIVIDRLLGSKKKGFYVDIGANDPIRFNNTNRFYERGWQGINIEPDTAFFEKLTSTRPKDINLNIGIGSSNKKLNLFKFFPDTLSTFSQNSAKKYIQQGFKLIGKVKIKVVKLSTVLNKYCKNTPIDFLSIDTEGYDLTVLKSNDWKRFRPKLICVEAQLKNTEVPKYLSKVGYREVFNNGLNRIFINAIKNKNHGK